VGHTQLLFSKLFIHRVTIKCMPEGQRSGGELSKVMAVLLVVQGSYTHVDKLSQASSKDLALYYAKEALRDYNSLLSSGKIEDPEAKALADSVNYRLLEEELDELRSKGNLPELREMVSYISSQALAKAADIRSRGTYNLAVKVVDWLRKAGKFPADVKSLSDAINANAAQISRELGVEEEEVRALAGNRPLLNYLTKKGGG
jgi:CRISPR-associated protein Csa5